MAISGEVLLQKRGIVVPEILIPAETPVKKWSVIACDQYTQDADYWKKASAATDGMPSTMQLIFPEVYLGDGSDDDRINAIKKTMAEYSMPKSGVFSEPIHGLMYIERTTAYGRCRKGLIAAIDLETYDWDPHTTLPIRATEATIKERIPPRMKIRRGAPLELPHIMLLANDPQKTLVESCGKRISKSEPTYDGDLMMDAGHITGWAVTSDEDIAAIADAVDALAKANTATDGSYFLFAVGDGNHSLATAKAVWDEYKAAHTDEPNCINHQARYALIEIVNLYDDGLTFEPIHRVLFNTNAQELGVYLTREMGGDFTIADTREYALHKAAERSTTCFAIMSGESTWILETPAPELAVSRLQPILDRYLDEHPQSSVDYIHGTDEVLRLASLSSSEKPVTGIILPPIDKDSFFSTIAQGGPLPRKSFSMGEASEKRFYLECRHLF